MSLVCRSATSSRSFPLSPTPPCLDDQRINRSLSAGLLLLQRRCRGDAYLSKVVDCSGEMKNARPSVEVRSLVGNRRHGDPLRGNDVSHLSVGEARMSPCAAYGSRPPSHAARTSRGPRRSRISRRCGAALSIAARTLKRRTLGRASGRTPDLTITAVDERRTRKRPLSPSPARSEPARRSTDERIRALF